jgi:hypothetical protein
MVKWDKSGLKNSQIGTKLPKIAHLIYRFVGLHALKTAKNSLAGSRTIQVAFIFFVFLSRSRRVFDMRQNRISDKNGNPRTRDTETKSD